MAETKFTRPTGSPLLVVEETQRVEDLARVATECAVFLFQIATDYGWRPAVGSARESEQKQAENTTGAGGELWPPEVFGQQTTSICTYLSAAAEHLDGFGVLCRAGAAVHPPLPVARAAHEISARAFWLLQSEASLEQRVARGLLDLAASYDFVVRGLPRNHNAEADAARAQAKADLKLLWKTHMPKSLGKPEFLDGKNGNWAFATLGGEHYLGPTDIARHFFLAEGGDPESSWSPYDLLCLGTHPNAVFFLDYAHLGTNAEGVTGRQNIVSAESLASALHIAVRPFIASVAAFWSWSGWDLDGLDVLCHRINEVLPNAARDDWGAAAPG